MHTVFQSETAGSSENQRLMELETTKQDLEYRLQEMTKTVEKQQEMLAMAKRDPLTGLRNRQGFPELVNASLRARCEGIFFIMDLDNFKSINDTYGHMEGDRVLVRFAKALRTAMDLADIIARLGGDEFVVFSPECYDKYEVKAKAQRFIRQIERSIVTPDRPMQVTISMGIAAAPHDGVTYEALYRNADKALYSVKNEGKDGYRFYADLDDKQISNVVYTRPHSSIEEITGKLRERKMEGSLEVEYDHFEKIYRFLSRNLIRSSRDVQCILFTLETDTDADEMTIQRQLEHLQHAIVSSLRKSDVTARYGPSQILVLLMDVNTENAGMVVKRILQKYHMEAGRGMMNPLYDIRQLATD